MQQPCYALIRFPFTSFDSPRRTSHLTLRRSPCKATPAHTKVGRTTRPSTQRATCPERQNNPEHCRDSEPLSIRHPCSPLRLVCLLDILCNGEAAGNLPPAPTACPGEGVPGPLPPGPGTCRGLAAACPSDSLSAARGARPALFPRGNAWGAEERALRGGGAARLSSAGVTAYRAGTP